MSHQPLDSNELPMKRVWLPDNIGFVELIGTFGDDLTVVNAARVSFDKTSLSLTEADKKLIRYLAKHEHTSPFFHPQVRFRIKMPIFVAREWYRHTVGFARNEVSRRYVDSAPECWVPAAESIRERDKKVKQGSKETSVINASDVEEILRKHTQDTVLLYNTLLEQNVAPEVARCILPQSMYTEFIETASLAAVARLCGLRLGTDAQKEIRDYATIVHEMMMDVFPVSWVSLSKQE